MPDILHLNNPTIGKIDYDHLYGPDRDGRYLKIVEETYDEDLEMIELRLKAVLGDELTEMVRPLIQQQRERDRIKALFIA